MTDGSGPALGARRRHLSEWIRTAAPALGADSARASTRSPAGPRHGHAGLCSPQQPGPSQRARRRLAGVLLRPRQEMERGIMGGFADAGLGLRAGTRTQGHGLGDSDRAGKEKLPATGPGGLLRGCQRPLSRVPRRRIPWVRARRSAARGRPAARVRQAATPPRRRGAR